MAILVPVLAAKLPPPPPLLIPHLVIAAAVLARPRGRIPTAAAWTFPRPQPAVRSLPHRRGEGAAAVPLALRPWPPPPTRNRPVSLSTGETIPPLQHYPPPRIGACMESRTALTAAVGIKPDEAIPGSSGEGPHPDGDDDAAAPAPHRASPPPAAGAAAAPNDYADRGVPEEAAALSSPASPRPGPLTLPKELRDVAANAARVSPGEVREVLVRTEERGTFRFVVSPSGRSADAELDGAARPHEPPPTTKLRLFVAVELPDDVRESLFRLVTERLVPSDILVADSGDGAGKNGGAGEEGEGDGDVHVKGGVEGKREAGGGLDLATKEEAESAKDGSATPDRNGAGDCDADVPGAGRSGAEGGRSEDASKSGGAVRWVKSPSLYHCTLQFLGEVEESSVEALCDALEEACSDWVNYSPSVDAKSKPMPDPKPAPAPAMDAKEGTEGVRPRQEEETETEEVTSAGTTPLPLRLSLGEVGCMPNLKKARVIKAGISDHPQDEYEGNGALAQLARAVQGATSTLGFKPDKRRFNAHVTLGRVREEKKKRKGGGRRNRGRGGSLLQLPEPLVAELDDARKTFVVVGAERDRETESDAAGMVERAEAEKEIACSSGSGGVFEVSHVSLIQSALSGAGPTYTTLRRFRLGKKEKGNSRS